MSQDRFLEATQIFEQLMKYTAQLANYESDPRIDVVALSRACNRRIQELKGILSDSAPPNRDPRFDGMLEELQRQAQICSDILQKERSKLSSQMAFMTKSRRAVRAYKA
ncbi:MAG: hypothetical protein LLG06_08170 [Desulfobacteraceae bacterium]|nr:hypothetical protein [Desulfobacteraceae bacterium]